MMMIVTLVCRSFSSLLLTVVLSLPAVATAGPCNPPAPQQRPLIFECEKQIVDDLTANKAHYQIHPDAAFNVVEVWDQEFSKRYYRLRQAGQNFSKSDAEIIRNEIWSKLDPVGIAVDEGIKAIVKKWVKQLSGLLAFFSSAPAQAVKVFFIPSQTGSDLDELIHANNRVHKALAEAVLPNFLDETWRNGVAAQIESMHPLDAIGPQLAPQR